MATDGAARILRNAIIIGGIITFVFIILHFTSGRYIGERLEGTWRAACVHSEIIFNGNTFIRGREVGEFRIRANLIYFCTNYNGYPIRITTRYMVLNGIYYFREE